MSTSPPLAALALMLLPPALLDDEESPGLPPQPPEYRVRHYMLDDEPDMSRLLDALTDLHEEASLVQGPESSSAAPRDRFIALRTPLEVTDREALSAVKKGRAKPVPLVWTHARWNLSELPPIPEELVPGTGSDQVRSMILGQHSDLHWFELRGQDLLFFYEPGSIDGEWLLERIQSGLAPYVAPDFSVSIVEERVVWELAGMPSARDVRAVERALGRLDHLSHAQVFEEPARLEFTLLHDSMVNSGPLVAFGSSAAADPNLAQIATGAERRPSFDPSELLELLADNDIELAPVEGEQ